MYPYDPLSPARLSRLEMRPDNRTRSRRNTAHASWVDSAGDYTKARSSTSVVDLLRVDENLPRAGGAGEEAKVKTAEEDGFSVIEEGEAFMPRKRRVHVQEPPSNIATFQG